MKNIIEILLALLFFVGILVIKTFFVDLAIENIFNIQVDGFWVFVLLLVVGGTK